MSSDYEPKISLPDRQTIERLIKIAQGDSGQCEKVANLLLAWWNARSCGGFDLIDLWGLDMAIRRDCCLLIGWLAMNQHYPDQIGFGAEFEALVKQWRPELLRERSRK